MFKKAQFWIVIFTLILISTQIHEHLSLQEISGILGFPKWLIYFGFIHIVIVIAIYFLGKMYYSNQDIEE